MFPPSVHFKGSVVLEVVSETTMDSVGEALRPYLQRLQQVRSAHLMWAKRLFYVEVLWSIGKDNLLRHARTDVDRVLVI